MPPQTATEAVTEILDVLEECGIPARSDGSNGLVIDGERIELQIATRAHPTHSELAGIEPSHPDRLTVVVADRLSEAAKETLRSNGVGWLDRRGSLRLWGPLLRLDVSFRPSARPNERRAPRAFTPAVRDVVLAILLDPGTTPSPRALARLTGRSAGYVSTILSGLEEDGLVQADGRALLPELFWALAEAWRPEWTYIDDPLADMRTEGVAVATGATGADAWGAPVLIGAGGPAYLILGSESTVRRLGEKPPARSAGPDAARAAIRYESSFNHAVVASPVVNNPLAHPVICALDLAEDQRGRETIATWRPRHPDLGTLAALEVYRRAEWVQVNWLEEILRTRPSEPLWNAVAATCWAPYQAEGLALLYQHPDTPNELRADVRERISAIVRHHEGVERDFVRYAPSLLLEEPFRSRDTEQPKSQFGSGDDQLRLQVQQGFISGRPKPAIRSATEEWLNEGQAGADAWESADGANYLLRLRTIADFGSGTLEALKALAAQPRPDWPYERNNQFDSLREQSLTVARAAAEQQGGSLLGGPEPGGIRGFLELASVCSGEPRHSVLREASQAWMRWIGVSENAAGRSAVGRRHMFHGGGDTTLPLVRFLAGEDMVDELRDVFAALRLAAGESSNTLEGYLAMSAWPALRNGSLDLVALFVAEARTETPWRRQRLAETQASSGTEPPDYPEFPDELVAFRCVWR